MTAQLMNHRLGGIAIVIRLIMSVKSGQHADLEFRQADGGREDDGYVVGLEA